MSGLDGWIDGWMDGWTDGRTGQTRWTEQMNFVKEYQERH